MTDDDFISIPTIIITDDWTVDDIETEDDCDDAFAVLTAICVSIEAKMDDLAMQGKELSVEHKKAKAALRWKKAALQVVQSKRGKINRKFKQVEQATLDRRIIAYFRAMHPNEFHRGLDHVWANTDGIIKPESAA